MKTAFITIGIILVIIGVIIALIFGGVNLSLDGLSGLLEHDLSKADANIDYDADQVNSIDINADCYSIYIYKTDLENISVKYVTPDDDDATISTGLADGTLSVTESDNITSSFSIWKNDYFILIQLPFSASDMAICCNVSAGGIKISDICATSLDLTINAGAVLLSDCKIDNGILIDSKTGVITVDDCECENLTAKTTTGVLSVCDTDIRQTVQLTTTTGAIKCEVNASSVILSSSTGAINFEIFANTINITASTGAVNGEINGDKSDYDISVSTGTGSCNLTNQTVGKGKSLTVKVQTGAINIKFSD